MHLTYGKDDAKECFDATNLMATAVVKSKVDTVFLVARWSIYASGDYSGEDIGFMVSEEPDDQFQSREEWQASFEAGVRKTVDFYRQAGIRVVLVPQVPQQHIFPENVLMQALMQSRSDEDAQRTFKRSFVRRADFDELISYADSVLAQVAEEYGAELISVNSFFEEDDRYAWFRDGAVLVGDGNHLTLRGALGVAPLLIEGFRP